MNELANQYIEDFKTVFSSNDNPEIQNTNDVLEFFNKYSTFISVITGIKFIKDDIISIIKIYAFSYITYIKCLNVI